MEITRIISLFKRSYPISAVLTQILQINPQNSREFCGLISSYRLFPFKQHSSYPVDMCFQGLFFDPVVYHQVDFVG